MTAEQIETIAKAIQAHFSSDDRVWDENPKEYRNAWINAARSAAGEIARTIVADESQYWAKIDAAKTSENMDAICIGATGALANVVATLMIPNWSPRR